MIKFIKIILLLFPLVLISYAFSDKALIKKIKPKAIAVITKKKAKVKRLALNSNLNDQEEGDCNQSGQSEIYVNKLLISDVEKIFKQTKGMVITNESYIKKGLPRQCPMYCEQENNYKTVSKVHPASYSKGSCKESESKELYSFVKEFPFEQNIASKQQAHKDMISWILSTFAYPFFIPYYNKGSKEYVENNISKACPSCSFYFNYSYRYTEDLKLLLDIQVACGDKKTFLSSQRAEFAFVNDWSCKEREMSNESSRQIL